MDKKTMNEQTNLAFEFMNKLNQETSYLIKEIEGTLKKENEEFVIGKVIGYAINAPNSLSLDTPEYWLANKLGVFFVPKRDETKGKGSTETPLKKDLKIIFLMIVLHDNNFHNPTIVIGTLYDIVSTSEKKKKFEDLVNELIDDQENVFKTNPEIIDYKEDKWANLKGKFIVKDLFDIKNADDVQKLIKQVLESYRNLK